MRLALLVLLSCSASAAGARDAYRPPEGFKGYAWETPLGECAGFAPEPVLVQTASSRGKVTELDMQCVPDASGGCDLERSLRTLHQEVEGEGFHALAEYVVESQGFRFRDTGALLYPVLWQFCARWGGFTDAIPRDIRERLKLCGMRLLFQSDTLEQLRARGDDYVTHYERVLRGLIAMHGEPEGYGRAGRVIVEAEDGARIAPPRTRRFNEWRWCRPRGRELAPSCSASIVLAFDPASGWGVVLYATRPVWEFAFARHNGGAKDDALYALLHGLGKYHPVDNVCTGSHLCRPGKPRAMSEERRAAFRLEAKTP